MTGSVLGWAHVIPAEPPVVTLTAPTDGGTSTAIPITVGATATAMAPASSIAQIQFRANGVLIGTATVAPFTVSWTPPNGTYTIQAIATDNLGTKGYSATRTHTVSAPVVVEPAPNTLELWDWTDSGSPTLVTTMTFNGADTSMTFDDTYVNAELGTVPVKAASTASWGGFDWGAIRWTLPGNVNDVDPGIGFHQVVIFCKPNVNWPGYPAATGYTKDGPSGSETFPPAFKFVMKDSGGNVLHTFETYDGTAINDWSLNQGPQHPGTGNYADYTFDTTKPIRPHFNCAQALPWTQRRTKINARAKWWYGGAADRGLRPSLCGFTFSTNAAWPLKSWGSDGRGQGDGTFQMRLAPLRPAPRNQAAGVNPTNDPYLGNWWDTFPIFVTQDVGLGYDPGNPGCIDQYTGPGGVRFDRGGYPTPLVEVLSGVTRVHGPTGLTFRQLLDHYLLNAFNLSFHFTGNVATGAPSLGKTATYLAGNRATSLTAWSWKNSYYYSSSQVVAGDAQAIDTVGMGNGSFDVGSGDGSEAAAIASAMRFYRRDPTTGKIRRPFNGTSIDHMHSHQFWGALTGFLNSPMHAWHMLHAIGANSLASNTPGWADFNAKPAGWWAPEETTYEAVISREKAYKFAHLAICWWLANNHPSFGVSRADIETELVRFLTTYHTKVYQPKWASASDTSPYWQGMRRFGMQVVPRRSEEHVPADGLYWLRLEDTPARCYFFIPFMIAAQTGLLDRLLTLGNTQIVETLTDLVATLDKYAVDGILDCGYAISQETQFRVGPIKSSFAELTLADMATDWANAVTINPPIGSASYMKNSSGVFSESGVAWIHDQSMWAIGAHHYLRGFFPNARSLDCFNFIESVHADHAAYVAAEPVLNNKRVRDWFWLHPCHAPPAPPVP